MLMIFFRYETPQFSILKANDEVAAKKILSKDIIIFLNFKGRIYYEEDVTRVIEYIKETNKGSGGVVRMRI